MGAKIDCENSGSAALPVALSVTRRAMVYNSLILTTVAARNS